jgi:hypothetical protein
MMVMPLMSICRCVPDSYEKSLTKGRSEEVAPLEKEEGKMTTGTLRARYPEARLFRLSNPCLMSLHRNMPPWTVRMRPLTTLPDLCSRSMRSVETS